MVGDMPDVLTKASYNDLATNRSGNKGDVNEHGRAISVIVYVHPAHFLEPILF